MPVTMNPCFKGLLDPRRLFPACMQVMLGYLKTYEHIGRARLSCVSGCRCQAEELDGLRDTQQRYSAPDFHAFQVSPHRHCQIQVCRRNRRVPDHAVPLASGAHILVNN